MRFKQFLEAENPLNNPSKGDPKFSLDDFAVRKVEPGLFEIEYRSEYSIGQNLFDRIDDVLAHNGLGIVRVDHPHRMFKYNVWTMQVHDMLDSMHDGEKMVSDESIEKRIKKSIEDLGKLHARTVAMIKHLLDQRGIGGVHDWLEDGGEVQESTNAFPVKESDFEISGPNDDAMWSIKIKNASIRTSADRDAIEWHLRTMKEIAKLILWTDVDEEISIYSPPFLPNLAADSFQITKFHQMPDYPVELWFRPAAMFPDMLSGNDEARKMILDRIARSKKQFMDSKLKFFLKFGIDNARSSYDDYNRFDDDVGF